MPTNRRTFLTASSAALFTALSPPKGFGITTTDRKIELLPGETIATIRPELHSHFAEHLGSCIYGGIWVGPYSPIPNINGYRKSRVEYLKDSGRARSALARRLLRRRLSLARRHRSRC